MVWAGDAISGRQSALNKKRYFPAAWELLRTMFVVDVVGFSGGAMFCSLLFQTLSVP